jgi:hypothetical protein
MTEDCCDTYSGNVYPIFTGSRPFVEALESEIHR